MKTDHTTGGGGIVPVYRHPLLQKISFCLSGLHGLKDPVAKRPVRWTPLAAALAAVLMGVIASGSLAERCEDSLLCLAPDFTRRRRVGRTYNGLMKALGRQELVVLPQLKADLRRQTLAALGRVRRTGGWTLLAVDGSKEALPRTRSHEQAFGIADNGKGPQALITAIVAVYTGLLWDWRVDQACASEKYHLLEMVEGLPAHGLLLADGNFVGYRIWAKLDQNHQDFLIRVWGNVSLLTGLWPEARLERCGDIVYVWPKHQQGSVRIVHGVALRGEEKPGLTAP